MNSQVLELKLERIFKGEKYTIGRLYVDCKYFCDTLENTDRGLTSCMSVNEILNKKINGETAIPKGAYPIVKNVISPKYSKIDWYKENFNGGLLARLVGVKGFEGILIHAGNTENDTDGCILVGQNKVKGQVINSRATLLKLRDALKGYKNILLTIE